MIEAEIFFQDNTIGTVMLYRILNQKGEFVEFLDYGASVHGIHIRDKFGNIIPVSLGASNGRQLLCRNCEGVTIGRVANVIANASYTCEGKTVQLEVNHPPDFLHGGSGNYAHKHFSCKILDEQTLCFQLYDTGEGGFDCNVSVSVFYTFDDNSRLTITYQMLPEGTTLLCPTNHTYFTLGSKDIRSLMLQINASEIPIRVRDVIVTDIRKDVSSTPFDFQKMRTIRNALNAFSETGHSHAPIRYNEYYPIKSGSKYMAELYNPDNGIHLRVSSHFPALILFTYLDLDTAPNEEYAAVCLEAQFMPNAVNCTSYEIPFYHAGEQLLKTTLYSFFHDRPD